MKKKQSSAHIPTYLKQGDKIGLISTARKINKEELQSAIELLTSWGLEIVLGQNLFNSYHQFSGTDQERQSDLQHMLDNEYVKGIICVRGGYGTGYLQSLSYHKFSKEIFLFLYALKNIYKWKPSLLLP